MCHKNKSSNYAFLLSAAYEHECVGFSRAELACVFWYVEDLRTALLLCYAMLVGGKSETTYAATALLCYAVLVYGKSLTRYTLSVC